MQNQQQAAADTKTRNTTTQTAAIENRRAFAEKMASLETGGSIAEFIFNLVFVVLLGGD